MKWEQEKDTSEVVRLVKSCAEALDNKRKVFVTWTQYKKVYGYLLRHNMAEAWWYRCTDSNEPQFPKTEICF